MDASFQLFNLGTMSGVFPGTRTMVFQRVRLRSLSAPPTHAWARLLWYDDPPACVVELNDIPLLRIPDPAREHFGARLQAGLAAADWELLTCGACTFWQPLTAATTDDLPLGCCTWQDRTAGVPASESDTGDDACGPDVLAMQSLLALDCPHWQAAATTARLPAGDAQPLARLADDSATLTIARSAERENDERWSWWGRLRRAWRRRQAQAAPPVIVRWQDRIVERSGVGAGTEPCYACQGRIANLGALAVASPENDKQTFSVWRCRLCCTYYLDDWIDRWERTDSLETEETYYRLAPHEALTILAVIDGVVDADHPARRHERHAQRAWMQQFLAGRAPLSHQVKQGR